MELLYNSLNTLIEMIYMDPDNSIITHIQESILLFRQRITDLLDSIGVGYFEFDYHKPYAKLQPRGSPTNPNKTTRGRKVCGGYICHPHTPDNCTEASQTDNMGSSCDI